MSTRWKRILATVIPVVAVVVALVGFYLSEPAPSPVPTPLPTWTWPEGTRTPFPVRTPGVVVVHGTPYACLAHDDAPGQPSDELAGADFDSHNCPSVS